MDASVRNDKAMYLVREIARLKKEGEGENGEEYDEEDGFVWEPDDAFETLENLISLAREIVGPLGKGQ